MNISCPNCYLCTIPKTDSIHSGKQKYESLACHKQFVEDPQNKNISDDTKERVQRSLIERVSLGGFVEFLMLACPWLLGFMECNCHCRKQRFYYRSIKLIRSATFM